MDLDLVSKDHFRKKVDRWCILRHFVVSQKAWLISCVHSSCCKRDSGKWRDNQCASLVLVFPEIPPIKRLDKSFTAMSDFRGGPLSQKSKTLKWRNLPCKTNQQESQWLFSKKKNVVWCWSFKTPLGKTLRYIHFRSFRRLCKNLRTSPPLLGVPSILGQGLKSPIAFGGGWRNSWNTKDPRPGPWIGLLTPWFREFFEHKTSWFHHIWTIKYCLLKKESLFFINDGIIKKNSPFFLGNLFHPLFQTLENKQPWILITSHIGLSGTYWGFVMKWQQSFTPSNHWLFS